MSIVDEFLSRYAKEFDFYQEAARICSQQCEIMLEQSGKRALVTYRAKRPDRLKDKVIDRNNKNPYKDVNEVYKDIADLAGVRIALYFPGDVIEVEKLINSAFIVDKTKIFPRDSPKPKYEKRFSGYAARHYRIHLMPASLSANQQRFSEALIEIQVASVLVHAWSEVEHDLVYKPTSGELSEDEYAILDELNGLVLAGEIALERLQRAAKLRIDKMSGKFNNHYELAAYIYDKIKRR